ncbi:Desiccation-related protein PCC27-45 [Hibiscus syriacus]|uniref:Desiccation-related protein PCC27-45 n=1 Tax=Hibiscus syriacus TaxID=106335 RepID=A0A6A3AX84_HIBSY|nr:Desiccation-related protein PCC27-45 [Hibiscus syriacus]
MVFFSANEVKLLNNQGKRCYQIDYVPAPRITEADKTNDRKSLQRALDRRLYLLLYGDSNGAPSGNPVWHFPENVYDSQGLSHTYFVGNAPMGHMMVKNFVSGKVAEMRKPEASIKGVDINSVSRDGVEYGAKVAVSNPYSHSIPICEIQFDLKSDGSEIVRGKIEDSGSLKGNDTTILEVPMKVPHNVLISLAKDICRDWDIDYELNVKLIIDLPVFGDITIPVSRQGEIKLPTLKDWF